MIDLINAGHVVLCILRISITYHQAFSVCIIDKDTMVIFTLLYAKELKQ